MTLTKLAYLANVSVSTVSKALSDSHEISDATKEMIFKIAKEQGCFEKYYKPKYSKKAIAVICPEILGIHYTQMATSIENEIAVHGGTMILGVSNFSHKTQNELIEYYTKFIHVDGIIVIEPQGAIKNETDTPIVEIGLESETKDADCVRVDIFPAMIEALSLLTHFGHTRIGFIGEKLAVSEYGYFKQAMKSRMLAYRESDVVISDKRFYDAGYFAMDEMLKQKDLPTVIFAAYSHIASGILERLKEEKMSVPDDISLICMDDITSVPYSDINLSCIKMHLEDLCTIAADLLFQKIEKNYIKTKQTITVTRKFTKRDSIKNLI